MRFDGFSDLLRYWAQAAPEHPALLYEAHGKAESLTYAQLEARVVARSEAIAREGERCLAVLCDGSVDCVIELLAAPSAGVQLVLLDESASEELLAEQIKRSDVDRLWGDAELVEALSPSLRTADEALSNDILFFTSGTTESAKAVVLTERSLSASAWNGSALLPLQPEDTLLCLLPLNHVFGFVCGLLWGLHCGATVALGRGARHYADDCAFYKPTAVSVVPALLGFLLKYQALNAELKLILVGAGDCPASLLNAAKAGGRRVSFGYGLTETSSGVALSLDDDPTAMTVCPEVKIEIADDGEIILDAPTTVMRGYYKAPRDTAEALRGGRLYTGDLGALDADGCLHITGRKKEMLVLGDGTKLFLPEYESRLAAALGEREFAVILSDGRPTLYIRGAEDERAAIETALRGIMAELPRGQQLAGMLFTAEPLPRTASGKIKRWEIQRKAGEKT